MHHFFLPAPLSEEALAAPLTFSRKDWQHLFVLRLREGEEFVLADGRGREHICRVTDVQKNSLTASVVASRDSARELDCQLILLQGLPKRDKLELIIQKAVELGASSIVPVMMARSNVRLDDKKADRQGRAPGRDRQKRRRAVQARHPPRSRQPKALRRRPSPSPKTPTSSSSATRMKPPQAACRPSCPSSTAPKRSPSSSVPKAASVRKNGRPPPAPVFRASALAAASCAQRPPASAS